MFLVGEYCWLLKGSNIATCLEIISGLNYLLGVLFCFRCEFEKISYVAAFIKSCLESFGMHGSFVKQSENSGKEFRPVLVTGDPLAVWMFCV